MQTRDFEFRVWDCKEKVLHYSGVMANFATYALLMDISNPHKIEIFTGFKDKNNKKIFEGDIIRINNAPRNLWQVQFSSQLGAFVLDKLGFKKPMHEFLKHPFCSFQVVGNIHKNAHLLK